MKRRKFFKKSAKGVIATSLIPLGASSCGSTKDTNAKEVKNTDTKNIQNRDPRAMA